MDALLVLYIILLIALFICSLRSYNNRNYVINLLLLDTQDSIRKCMDLTKEKSSNDKREINKRLIEKYGIEEIIKYVNIMHNTPEIRAIKQITNSNINLNKLNFDLDLLILNSEIREYCDKHNVVITCDKWYIAKLLLKGGDDIVARMLERFPSIREIVKQCLSENIKYPQTQKKLAELREGKYNKTRKVKTKKAE